MAIPSPRATKISALPNVFGSSLVAPIAAGAEAATAIPPPIADRPMESAAAIMVIPNEESGVEAVSVVSVAGASLLAEAA
jgi:hypothetical protein